MKNNKTYRLVVTAMLIAIATVLNQFAVIQLPYGGGVTIFSQVPIIAVGYIFGPLWGLVGGFTMSLLQMLFGLENLSYVTGISGYLILILLDYLVPYTMLGLGGILKGKLKNSYVELTAGTVLVCIIRLLCHIITGVTIWKSYCPEGTAVLIYSIFYNSSYMVPETIVSVIGILALSKFLFPRLDENGVLK